MASFWRLFGFLRPYRRAVWAPLLRVAGDGDDGADPVSGRKAVGRRSRTASGPDLLPLALVILGAGVLRLGLTVVRRIIAGKVSLAVEFDLRERMYASFSAWSWGSSTRSRRDS